MNTLYLECFSGISGDMTVGALLDLGASEERLRAGLESLHLDGYRVEVTRVSKNGIGAASFDVILDEEGSQHSHHHEDGEDHVHLHEYHHEHSHSHEHEHHHDHEHGGEHHHDTAHHDQEQAGHGLPHCYEHEHVHGHSHDHPHVHRGLREILPMIRQSGISEKAKDTAEQIFRVLAEAEGKVHGKPPEEVHFHEVGAVDSIVDIVSIAICLDDLAIGTIICSPLSEGTGTVWCQHGIVPVPAPATLELARAHGIPLKITSNQGEMVTPTGAATVAALVDSFILPDSFRIKKIGIGAGKKDFPQANVLRAMLIEPEGEEDLIEVLECNVDDCTPEQLGYCQEMLFRAGARDVQFTSVYMKKNRPGTEIKVICLPEKEEELVRILFRESTTIGVRKQLCRRSVMTRRESSVATDVGEIGIKVCSWKDVEKTYVEYESAAAAARASGKPVDEIYRKAYGKLAETGNMQKMQEK